MVNPKFPGRLKKPAQERDWCELYRLGGYGMLSNGVFETEGDLEPLRSVGAEETWHATRRLLAAVPEDALFAIFDGNLSLARAQKYKLADALDENYKTAQMHISPSIYMLELVSEKTEAALSATQLLKLLAAVEVYLAGAHDPSWASGLGADDVQAHAWVFEVETKIDGPMTGAPSAEEANKAAEKQADIKAGKRRYLPDPQHVALCRLLIKHVRRRIKKIDPKLHVLPMEQPLREVGYAPDGRKRMNSRQHHRSSNTLTNLFESVARVVCGNEYRLHGHIISLPFALQEAVVSEAVFSCLAGAQLNTGMGFCYQAPGQVDRSALGTTWDRNLISNFTLYATPFEANDDADKINLERLQSLPQQVAEKRKEVEARQEKIKAKTAGLSEEATERRLEQLREIVAHKQELIAAKDEMNHMIWKTMCVFVPSEAQKFADKHYFGSAASQASRNKAQGGSEADVDMDRDIADSGADMDLGDLEQSDLAADPVFSESDDSDVESSGEDDQSSDDDDGGVRVSTNSMASSRPPSPSAGLEG